LLDDIPVSNGDKASKAAFASGIYRRSFAGKKKPADRAGSTGSVAADRAGEMRGRHAPPTPLSIVWLPPRRIFFPGIAKLYG